MRTSNEKVVWTLLPVAIGAGVMMALLTVMNAIEDWKNVRPHVGDMMAFTASSQPSVDGGLRLVAQRPGQFGCVLDLNILQRSGGSFVVEGQLTEAASMFHVHWAGGRTTADSGNCGGNADLILDADELDILASAASGLNPLAERDALLLLK